MSLCRSADQLEAAITDATLAHSLQVRMAAIEIFPPGDRFRKLQFRQRHYAIIKQEGLGADARKRVHRTTYKYVVL